MLIAYCSDRLHAPLEVLLAEVQDMNSNMAFVWEAIIRPVRRECPPHESPSARVPSLGRRVSLKTLTHRDARFSARA